MADHQANYQHITTVLFDMDGTLIQHTWRLEKVCRILFEQFADRLAPITQAEFFDCFWGKSEDMWFMMVDGVLTGEVGAKYAYQNTLRALGLDTGLAEPMLAYWTDLVLTEAVPFDDTYTVLETVGQRYKTGILTNGYIDLQRQKIEKYDLTAYVDFTLVSEEAGFHKPDARAFHEALKLVDDVPPAEALYVGDNLTADIQGARGAGITPIFMNPRGSSGAPADVVEIRRLSDLLTLLGLV